MVVPLEHHGLCVLRAGQPWRRARCRHGQSFPLPRRLHWGAPCERGWSAARMTARQAPSALCQLTPGPTQGPGRGSLPAGAPGRGRPAHLLKDAIVPHFVGALVPHDQNLQGEKQQTDQQTAAPASGDGPQTPRGRQKHHGRVLGPLRRPREGHGQQRANG